VPSELLSDGELAMRHRRPTLTYEDITEDYGRRAPERARSSARQQRRDQLIASLRARGVGAQGKRELDGLTTLELEALRPVARPGPEHPGTSLHCLGRAAMPPAVSALREVLWVATAAASRARGRPARDTRGPRRERADDHAASPYAASRAPARAARRPGRPIDGPRPAGHARAMHAHPDGGDPEAVLFEPVDDASPPGAVAPAPPPAATPGPPRADALTPAGSFAGAREPAAPAAAWTAAAGAIPAGASAGPAESDRDLFGRFHGIEPRWAWAARLAGLVALLPPAAAVALALGLKLHRLIGRGITDGRALAVVATVFGLAFAWRLVMPGLAQPRWRYRVDDRVLVVEYGVIVLRSVLVPLSRIQHVDIHRGPFDRLFGLSTLVLNTAGTSDDDVPVPGLAPELAERLRDHVVRQSGLADRRADEAEEPADGL
jgi:hypothetical protein